MISDSNRKIECYFSDNAKFMIRTCLDFGMYRDLAISVVEQILGDDMFVLPESDASEWTKNLLNA